MKKQSVNTIAKRFFLGSLLAAAVLFSASASAHNNTDSLTTADPAVTKAEIKYIGIDTDELLSFTVKFNNPSGSKFTLLVFDENNENLFKATYADTKFNKAFKLPKTSINKLTFQILGAKENFKEVFDVNISTREIADVVVRKN